jgi:hypothetical protein
MRQASIHRSEIKSARLLALEKTSIFFHIDKDIIHVISNTVNSTIII